MTARIQDDPRGGDGADELETVADWIEAEGWYDGWLARHHAPDACETPDCDGLPMESPDPYEERRRFCADCHEPHERPTVTLCKADGFGDDPADRYIGRHTHQSERVSILSFAQGRLDYRQRGYLGNPYVVGEPDTPGQFGRGRSVARFAATLEWLIATHNCVRSAVVGLSGCRLGCWCRHADDHEPVCHGDVLAAWCDSLNAPACEPGEHKITAYRRAPGEQGLPEALPWELMCSRCGRTAAHLPARETHPVVEHVVPDLRGGVEL